MQTTNREEGSKQSRVNEGNNLTRIRTNSDYFNQEEHYQEICSNIRYVRICVLSAVVWILTFRAFEIRSNKKERRQSGLAVKLRRKTTQSGLRSWHFLEIIF